MNETDSAVVADKSPTDAASTQTPSQPDDIDSLLKEFDAAVQAQQPIQASQTTQQRDTKSDDLQELRQFQRAYVQDKAREELDKMVSKLQKDVPGLNNIDQEIISHYLNGRASNDQRLVNAFRNRNSNPSAWNKVLNSLGNELAGKIGASKSDAESAKVNHNRAAVADALGSASLADSKPKEADISKMSNAEFRKWEREHGIKSQFGF